MQSGNMKLSSVPSYMSAVPLSTSSVCFALLEEQEEQEALCRSEQWQGMNSLRTTTEREVHWPHPIYLLTSWLQFVTP